MHTSSHSYTPVAATQGVDLCPSQKANVTSESTLSASGHGSDVLQLCQKGVLPQDTHSTGVETGVSGLRLLLPCLI